MASGIALGINYLHTVREGQLVIHGNLEMKHVLISDGFEPKVSDVMRLGRVLPCGSLKKVLMCYLKKTWFAVFVLQL